jgi:hypothetical protein
MSRWGTSLCAATAFAVGMSCAVRDEARRAGLEPQQLIPQPISASADYFHDMDYNLVNGTSAPPLSPDEIAGRNMWIVWTGGNDRLWDRLTIDSLGTFDLLKIMSSRPKAPSAGAYGSSFGRHNRWEYFGLVNEPCFKEPTGPDPNRFGLWLDVRDPSCPPDPFADADKYPGVRIGARGKTVPVGSYYGEPTGIVGLRLFSNPDFDERARKRWDSEKYYNDPAYYFDRDLVRPYRVGMSCGFCHVGPNPIRPPTDPENPKWENLSSNVGAQYFWWDRVFNWRGLDSESSFFYQALHVSRPGSLDTSLVSTDNINNPRTMNAVYHLAPRMAQARKWGKETISGGGLRNKQFNDFVSPTDPLAQFFNPPSTVFTPRVLKDGADSVGALGALNRVYINIGVFSEEWLRHFRALIGGVPISPITLESAQTNSVYWQATERQTLKMAQFLLASTPPHYLKDAPGGSAYLTADAATMTRGKTVFAERCARCHSSDIPDLPAGLDLQNANGPKYLDAWKKYWAWTKTEEFKAPMRAKVLAGGFLKDNYLSTELRVPIDLLGINACSPLGTNAIRDNIWDNFSSESYKQLPSVGTIKIRNPVTGVEYDYPLPAGGRGYIRPASLVSLWSTAPFLQNNTVGPFYYHPSVESRMKSFQASIRQMLWPEERPKDDLFPAPGPGIGVIDRLSVDSYLEVPRGYVPPFLRPLIGLFPGDGTAIKIGPFPKGMPIGLITNMDLMGFDLPLSQRPAYQKGLLSLLRQMKQTLKPNADPGEVRALEEKLLAFAKCRDFVVNKGHYFGTSYFDGEPGLSDDDKKALIEFLKTF